MEDLEEAISHCHQALMFCFSGDQDRSYSLSTTWPVQFLLGIDSLVGIRRIEDLEEVIICCDEALTLSSWSPRSFQFP